MLVAGAKDTCLTCAAGLRGSFSVQIDLLYNPAQRSCYFYSPTLASITTRHTLWTQPSVALFAVPLTLVPLDVCAGIFTPQGTALNTQQYKDQRLHKKSIQAMRGISALCCALAAVHGATGFVVPLPGRVSLQAARTPAIFRAVAPSASSRPDRLCMSATELPKFSVSLMDDTRVSFDMKKENLQLLAAEVRHALNRRYRCRISD